MYDSEAANAALLLFRSTIGIVLIAHGYAHIFKGGRIQGTASWFEKLGMRPGALHAWTASITELTVGLLLIVGFLTPVAGAGVVGVMVVAWVTNHMKNGFFIYRPGEGYEYVMTLTACGLLLTGTGAGRWSVDHAVGIFAPPGGWTAAFLACVAFGSAAALLLTFWRPGRYGAATHD